LIDLIWSEFLLQAFTEEQMNVLSQMERQSDAREQQIMRIAKSVQELAQV
jgi:hypothetical protein